MFPGNVTAGHEPTREGEHRPEAMPLAAESAEARIGRSWKDLRRGAATQKMRERVLGDRIEQAQIDALDALVELGGARMSDLARTLWVEASTATRTVNRAEAAGLVRRVASQSDGRVVSVEMTPEGHELAQDLNLRRQQMLLAVLAEFEPEEREDLADLLERFVSGIHRFVDG